jgi:hypothetical protein
MGEALHLHHGSGNEPRTGDIIRSTTTQTCVTWVPGVTSASLGAYMVGVLSIQPAVKHLAYYCIWNVPPQHQGLWDLAGYATQDTISASLSNAAACSVEPFFSRYTFFDHHAAYLIPTRSGSHCHELYDPDNKLCPSSFFCLFTALVALCASFLMVVWSRITALRGWKMRVTAHGY